MSFTFIIDGVTMPTPDHKGFKVGFADADSEASNRNARGYLNRDRLRAGLRKLEVTYSFLDQAKASKVLTAVEPPFVQVRYLDPQHGVITRTMYVGDRSLPMYGKDAKGNFRWENLSFSLVER